MSDSPSEITGSDNEEATLAAINLIRGTLISSFSYVEFLFADLYFRSRDLPDYKSISRTFPYTVASRISRIKTLVAMDGPVARYRAEVMRIADKLSDFENLRKFMAHGLLIVYPEDRGPYRISFRAYDQPAKDKQIHSEMQCSVEQLSAATRELQAYALDVATLFSVIYSNVGLQQVETQVPSPQAGG